MTYKISRDANKETFVHYTYLWNILTIQQYGLRQSRDGLMGTGIYCCRARDKQTCDEIIDFLSEEIHWSRFERYFPNEPHTGASARKVIHPIYFISTGSFLLGEKNPNRYSDVAGYALIPRLSIEPSHLVIGCAVADGIKPEI